MLKKSKFNVISVLNENKILLFNTRTFALVELDQLEYLEYNTNSYNETAINEYKRCGFLVYSDDEIFDLNCQRNSYCENCQTLHATIMLTDFCNFRCPYCYQSHSGGELSSKELPALKKFIQKHAPQKTSTVNLSWFGGEPLLNLNPLFEIEEYLVQNRISGDSHITTNGYLITEKLLNDLRSKTRVQSFQITLDGLKNTHDKTRILSSGKGTFEKIIHNIQLAIEHEFTTIIRINLSKKNKNLKPFLSYINSLNLNKNFYSIHVAMANHFSTSQEIDDFYFSDAEEYATAFKNVQIAFSQNGYTFPRNEPKLCGCEFENRKTFLITPDLNLYFCSSIDNNRRQSEDKRIGTILSSGETLKNENFAITDKLINPFRFNECRDCRVLPMCMGSCTLFRINNELNCIPEKFYTEDFVQMLYKEEIGDPL